MRRAERGLSAGAAVVMLVMLGVIAVLFLFAYPSMKKSYERSQVFKKYTSVSMHDESKL